MNIAITGLPLKLESYFFTNTEVHFAPLKDGEGQYSVNQDIDISTGFAENGKKKQVTVTIGSDGTDENGNAYNLSYKISVVGNFVNQSEEEETDKIKAVMYANAVSILVGAIRERLAELTAQGPFSTYFLPSLLVSVKTSEKKAAKNNADKEAD